MQLLEVIDRPGDNDYNYYLIFRWEPDYYSVQTVLKYLVQLHYGVRFFTDKQTEALGEAFKELFKIPAVQLLGLILYNYLTQQRRVQIENKEFNADTDQLIPFMTSNIYVNVRTFQVMTPPLHRLSDSVLQQIAP